MPRYPAIVEHDQEADLYGVMFPDLDGIVATGKSFDEALTNAEAALHDYLEGGAYAEPSELHEVEVTAGHVLVSMPAVLPLPGSKALEVDVGTLAFIDVQTKARGLTPRAYVTWMARRIAAMGG